MKHVMLDCYGANARQLDDMKLINEVLNQLVYRLQIRPIEPPQLLPYYYGSVKEDIGVSARVLLEGGHVTIHTFPMRECYFVDIFYAYDFDENEAYHFFLDELIFNPSISNFAVRNRDINTFNMVQYQANQDFGPHILIDMMAKKEPTMEMFFDFLENLVTKINMDPITRATVLKSTPNHPKYLSAIIIIAQSHIALHYDYQTKKIYADIFSCAPFDYTSIGDEFIDLGTIISNELVVRGSKHIEKIKNPNQDETLQSQIYWQKVIAKK